MKYLKMLGLAAVAAMALTAFTAGSASATTLEVGGTPQTGSTAITASLASGSSAVLRTTGGLFANTCTSSHVAGATTSPFTVANSGEIDGSITTLTFTNCSEEPVVVDEKGLLYVSWIEGTTNGTVTAAGQKVTVPSPFGVLTCVTGAGTDIGTLTGATTAGNPGAHAVMDINGVINCGIISSALWQGTYTVTSPTDLGVIK